MPAIRTWLQSWTRSEAIAAVFAICFLNGIVTKVQSYISAYGVEPALAGLFGISALVLICGYLAMANILHSEKRALTRADILVFTLAVAANLIATPVISWILLTALATREYLRHGQDRNMRRGAALMIGLTMPMFWGRLVFALASSTILKADAFLVSLMTSSQQSGNVVALSNGAGYIWIADACSSFGNISLAMLCWLMFMEYRGRRERTVNDYFVCIFACINIVIVNVTRIALIVKRPDLYELVHGPYGATIAGYISTLLVLVVCSSGIKREPKLAV
jgi:multisubunit Na+/H+ antiporter MnhG subunit